MSANMENRVRQLEQQVSVLRRELSQAAARLAAPLAPRQGIVLGVLTTAWAQGGTATVRVIGYNSAEFAYVDIEGIEVSDFWLNTTDDEIPVDTKVICFWYRNVWIGIPYCAASDTLPEDQAIEDESGQTLTTEGGNALQFNVPPPVLASLEDGTQLTTENNVNLLMES